MHRVSEHIFTTTKTPELHNHLLCIHKKYFVDIFEASLSEHHKHF